MSRVLPLVLILFFLACSNSKKDMEKEAQKELEKALSLVNQEEYQKAIKPLQNACEGIKIEACRMLALLYNTKIDDKEGSKAFYQKAGKIYFEVAKVALKIADEKKEDKEIKKAKEGALGAFAMACDFGLKEACTEFDKLDAF